MAEVGEVEDPGRQAGPAGRGGRRGDRLGADRLVAGAALGVEEAEKFLQGSGVCGVPQESTFTPNLHQVLVLQLVQMV